MKNFFLLIIENDFVSTLKLMDIDVETNNKKRAKIARFLLNVHSQVVRYSIINR